MMRSGLLLAGTLLAAVPAAKAQEPMQPADFAADSAELVDPSAAALDARAADIAAQLRCPVCSGQSVLESNAGISQEMQAVIREQLAVGRSEDEILAYFVGAYGDWIILKPRAIGLGLLVYVLPVLVLVAGGVWVWLVLRRWSAAPERMAGDAESAAGTGALSAEDQAWIQRSMGR